MIEKQYEMILELHGDWLDKAFEKVAQDAKGGSLDTREFARRASGHPGMPDGLQALTKHHFHEVVERRLEELLSVGRTEEQRPSLGWRVFKVIDVLDALAKIE